MDKPATPTPAPALDSLPHDIRGLVDYPDNLQQILLITIIVLVLIAAAYMARHWQRRWQGGSLPVKIPEYQKVLNRLDKLNPQEPFNEADREKFFYELSGLLRLGIEVQSTIPATDLTLRELERPLRASAILPEEDLENLFAFLKRCELIKFAKFPSNLAEAHHGKTLVQEWILEIHREQQRVAELEKTDGGASAATAEAAR